jgi:hypothetical protein
MTLSFHLSFMRLLQEVSRNGAKAQRYAAMFFFASLRLCGRVFQLACTHIRMQQAMKQMLARFPSH